VGYECLTKSRCLTDMIWEGLSYVYLVPSDTRVLEVYLLKNLKLPHDEFLYDESFNSYHSHIYMLARIGKPAHRLLALC
jgi:hypothetical protein